MKRRPDRRLSAIEQFEKIGVDPVMFEAIDGREQIDIPTSWLAGAGAWGCKESHRRILEECIRDGITSVAVTEDDVVFSEDFKTRFPAYLSELDKVAPDWKATFLGGQHLSPPIQVSANVVRCAPPKGCHRTHAYLLKGQYIRILHELFSGANDHIDKVWAKHQDRHTVYGPMKWLAGQTGSKSDICARELPERFWEPKRVIPVKTKPKTPTPNQKVAPWRKVLQPKGCTSCGKTSPTTSPAPIPATTPDPTPAPTTTPAWVKESEKYGFKS
jgi:GR25 family glycosyltransferase involved in LPS biosynthesis